MNFPAVDVASVKGVRAVEAAPRADFGMDFANKTADRYEGSWVEKPAPTAQVDTDIDWLARGYITVTPDQVR